MRIAAAAEAVAAAIGARDVNALRGLLAPGFVHRTHDIFLVTRLDGYTVDDVIKLIDRGVAPRREAASPSRRRGDPW